MGKGKKRDVGPSEPGFVPPAEVPEPPVSPSSSHPPPVIYRVPESPLITPCYCSGSLEWVHQRCLQQWIKSSQTRSCEVCRYSFHMQTKLKPFRRWEKLDITSVERRKILCSVTFHVIAITCVIWSLYVLIDRTAEEIAEGQLDWPFWTKLVVVAIGFTGGVVFMYVQCKMYLQLFRRWKAYNKVIYVQNCPDAMTSQGPTKHSLPQAHVVLELKTQHTVHITPAPNGSP